MRASGRSLSSFGLPGAGPCMEAPPCRAPSGAGSSAVVRDFARMRRVPQAGRCSEERIGASLCGGVERPSRA